MTFSSRFSFVLAVVALGVPGCASHTPMADSAASASAKTSQSAPERPADLVPGAPSDSIVAIHRSKCGACHTRVEPGSVSRATAESAMQRHRRRAKLTEREWEQMVDYLSADGASHGRPTARLP